MVALYRKNMINIDNVSSKGVIIKSTLIELKKTFRYHVNEFKFEKIKNYPYYNF